MQPLPPPGDNSDPMFGRSVAAPVDYGFGSRRSGRATANQRRYIEEASDADDDSEDDDNGSGTPLRARASSPRRQAAGGSSRATPAQGPPSEPPEIPGQRLGLPPPANKLSVKRASKTPHIYFSELDNARAADHLERLIPIRIELETETHRIKDTFLWNASERLVSVHQFVKVFLQDMDLPFEPYGPILEGQMKNQLEDWSQLANVHLAPAPGGVWSCRDPDPARGERGRGDIKDKREKRKDARMWNWGIEREFRRYMQPKGKKRKIDDLAHIEGQNGSWEDDLRVMIDVSRAGNRACLSATCRRLIFLPFCVAPSQYDVQILRHSLRDRLEWDLSSPLTPEAFAAQTCKDIGLSGEALPIIATAVRESILNHRRAVLDEGLFGLGDAWGAADEAEMEARQEIEAMKVQKRLGADEAAATKSENLPTLLESSAKDSRAPSKSPMPPPPLPVSRLGVPLPQTDGQTDGESGTASPILDAEDASDATPPPTLEPKVDPRYKLAQAVAEKQRFTERGPRPLTSVWRDWFESKQFGPLLEYISNEDMEKREMEALRATRRQRREAARFTGSGGGGSRGESKSSRLHFRMNR